MSDVVMINVLFNPYLTVAWTLYYELYFYCIVGVVLLVSGRHFRSAAIIGAVIFAGYIVARNMSGLVPFVSLNLLILNFLLGVVVFYMVSRDWVVLAAPLTVIGAIGLIVGTQLLTHGGVASHHFSRLLYVGLPSATLVYGMIGLERTWKAPNWAVMLGNASYSTYLWHWPLIAALRFSFLPSYPSIGTSCAVVAGMLCCGQLSHRYIEQPIAKAMKALRASFKAKRMPVTYQK